MRRRVLLCLTACWLVPACGPPQETAKTDHAKMQGKWTVLTWETSGEPPESFNNMRVIIKGDSMLFEEKFKEEKSKREMKSMWVMTFRLNPAKRPKTIDLQLPGKPEKLGIYELEGDTLKVCFDTEGERPKEFAIEAKSGKTLFVLQRE
jgi:uncharacterized protein (TIGR03067 family)